MMPPEIGKQPRGEEGKSTGMEAVVGNEDLLTQILLRLPVRSQLRFKSVSRHWFSLISNPRFILLQSQRCCKHVSGLLQNPRDAEDTLKQIELVPLDHDCHPPFQSFDFFDGLDPLQYYNGLLLFKTTRKPGTETNYYVINPTTGQQHAGVSFPAEEFPDKALGLYSVALAFDPRKSPYFKLVFLFRCGTGYDSSAPDYCVRIYSSETGLMTQPSHDLFHTSSDCLLYRGIYWNGAVNWIDYISGLYFKVDEERFGMLPMPPAPRQDYGRGISYYGESSDHLYLVQTETTVATEIDVYEMDREYSGWFMRFHVDLRPMFRAFPAKTNSLREDFSILSVVDRDDDDGGNSFIVFGRPGKAIRFRLKDGIFTKLCDFSDVNCEEYLPLWSQSMQLVQSLHLL